jgi:hypothetical protein
VVATANGSSPESNMVESLIVHSISPSHAEVANDNDGKVKVRAVNKIERYGSVDGDDVGTEVGCVIAVIRVMIRSVSVSSNRADLKRSW